MANQFGFPEKHHCVCFYTQEMLLKEQTTWILKYTQKFSMKLYVKYIAK